MFSKKFLLVTSVISITLITIINRLESFGRLFEGDTLLSAILTVVSTLIFFRFVNQKFLRITTDYLTRFLFFFWFAILFFGFLRGLFKIESYWDLKLILLTNLPFALVSLNIFIGSNIKYTKFITSFFMRYMFLFGFFLIGLSLVTNDQLYTRIMVPVTFLFVFIPYVKKRWALLIILVALVSTLTAIGLRIHLFKIIISLLVLMSFYLKFFKVKFFRFINILFFLIPTILFIYGVSTQFNFFEFISNEEGYSYNSISRGNEVSFNDDTRTFLYYEVFASIDNAKELVFGKSMLSNYNSDFFDSVDRIGVRNATEVCLLNLLLSYGVIGVFCFSLIIFRISFLAINYSNNKLSKMLGLIISSRYISFFVEDHTYFDLNFYFFWLIIGLLSSVQFRNLTDRQLKIIFKN